jgi:hypothetical protein
MVLSSRNSGKYLSGKWARERELCARNKDNYTTDEQAYYEVGDGYPAKGDGDRFEDTMKIDSTPVDPLTPSRKDVQDIRLLPQMGGKI